jgi:hypothetical protein
VEAVLDFQLNKKGAFLAQISKRHILKEKYLYMDLVGQSVSLLGGCEEYQLLGYNAV